jgi:hydroxymethylbilane synthase
VPTIRILSRASALAVTQAEHVGAAIRKRWPDVAVTFLTRASAGDRDRVVALSAAGEKGLFTADLSDALAAGHADLVVHSWKDLPIAPRPDTVIAGTLPRADVRDVLLVRREAIARAPATLRVLTSSPRRAWQITAYLSPLLPWRVDLIAVAAVRGNVPTRLEKLLRSDGDALVVAKAALDRLLDAGTDGDTRAGIRGALEQCRWMVLPRREFPTAPAQGALAIEAARGNQAVIDRVNAITDLATEQACIAERAILASYGGGCHEAIGASVVDRTFGRVTSVRGRLKDGSVLARWELDRDQPVPPTTGLEFVWPRPDERGGGTRRPRPNAESVVSARALWITRADAWPRALVPRPDQVLWAAGPRTWEKLAARGLWVNGSADGLGDEESPNIDALAGGSVDWQRLTHGMSGDEAATATYDVHYELPADLTSRTHFFWTSGSVFRQALARHPTIRMGWHASGPGRTAHAVGEALRPTDRASIWLDYDTWLESILP